jgi:hypothetical protein
MMAEVMGEYTSEYLSENDYSSNESDAFMGYTEWQGKVGEYYNSYGEAVRLEKENAEKSLVNDL